MASVTICFFIFRTRVVTAMWCLVYWLHNFWIVPGYNVIPNSWQQRTPCHDGKDSWSHSIQVTDNFIVLECSAVWIVECCLNFAGLCMLVKCYHCGLGYLLSFRITNRKFLTYKTVLNLQLLIFNFKNLLCLGEKKRFLNTLKSTGQFFCYRSFNWLLWSEKYFEMCFLRSYLAHMSIFIVYKMSKLVTRAVNISHLRESYVVIACKISQGSTSFIPTLDAIF
jgi:hypothetical protein